MGHELEELTQKPGLFVVVTMVVVVVVVVIYPLLVFLSLEAVVMVVVVVVRPVHIVDFPLRLHLQLVAELGLPLMVESNPPRRPLTVQVTDLLVSIRLDHILGIRKLYRSERAAAVAAWLSLSASERKPKGNRNRSRSIKLVVGGAERDGSQLFRCLSIWLLLAGMLRFSRSELDQQIGSVRTRGVQIDEGDVIRLKF